VSAPAAAEAGELGLWAQKAHADRAYVEALGVVRRLIALHGAKEVADFLDLSAAQLHNKLNATERNKLSASELTRLLALDPHDELIEVLRGARARRSDAEELKRIRAAVRDEFGPAGDRLIARLG